MRKLEIDIFKNIALILMIIYHTFFMIDFMKIYHFNMNSGLLKIIASISHNTFITLAGVNLYLSYKNNKKKKFFKKQNKRVFKIIKGAIFMNIFSYFAFGDILYIKFGILHFMATAILMSYPIVHSKYLTLIVSMTFYLISNYVKNNSYKMDFCEYSPLTCFILGIYNKHNIHISSYDHFSILHSFGLFSFGIFLGHLFYENDKLKEIDIKNNNELVQIFEKFSKNTFNIYLLHWPILYIIFYIYSLILIKKIEN